MQVRDRSLLSLSWPLILTFGVGTLQPMMDSWFLSRTSETAAAGVGALMPVLGALFMAIQAFSQEQEVYHAALICLVYSAFLYSHDSTPYHRNPL